MLPKKESLSIEFKSDIKKLSDSEIFEAVVAFANTDGGELYLGIEDNGEVTGVHKAHLDITTVSAFIANNTVPPVSVRAEIIDDIKPVLRISVPKSYSGITATVVTLFAGIFSDKIGNRRHFISIGYIFILI